MFVLCFVPQESWQFLQNCDYNKNITLKSSGLSISPAKHELIPEDDAQERPWITWDTNAFLYQYLPTVVFALHLVHEVENFLHRSVCVLLVCLLSVFQLTLFPFVCRCTRILSWTTWLWAVLRMWLNCWSILQGNITRNCVKCDT